MVDGVLRMVEKAGMAVSVPLVNASREAGRKSANPRTSKEFTKGHGTITGTCSDRRAVL
jgi:hypothetical protein